MDAFHGFFEKLWQISAELAVLTLVFLLIERVRPHKNSRRFNKDFWKEVSLGLMNGTIFGPVFTLGVTFVLIVGLKNYVPYQIFDEQLTLLPITAQMFIGAFIIDFATYWRHRLMHRHLWPYHSVHHSAEELNWITALRLHPVEVFVATIFDVAFLHMLGFSGSGIAMATLFIHFYNFYTHANINVAYEKPFCYIFASPNYHRWHHATDKKAYDKNFCGMFSLLDVMFGTYYHPEGKVPEAYGLSPQEQKDVPRGLLPHLFHPFRMHAKRIKNRRAKEKK